MSPIQPTEPWDVSHSWTHFIGEAEEDYRLGRSKKGAEQAISLWFAGEDFRAMCISFHHVCNVFNDIEGKSMSGRNIAVYLGAGKLL